MLKSFKNKKFIATLVASLMTASLVAPINVRAAEEEISLQILASSDMHGRFLPYDYAVDAADTSGSMAQLATMVKELRAANPNTVLVDNGDTIQDNSSSLFNNDEVHPMVLAMNEMAYDTWSLGNHEFNYGVPMLQKIASKFKGTTLCGNVFDKAGKSLGEPYKIVEKNGVKIAVIGMVTPHITKWDGPNLKDYVVKNPVEETRKIVDQIKDKVDVMVVTLHAGENSEYGNGDSARELAKACPEVAAIVAGHAHSSVKEAKEGNVVITEPTKGASELSKIDIKVIKNPNGKFTVKSVKSDLLKASVKGGKTYEVDKDLTAKLQPYSDRAIKDARTPIGELKNADLAPVDEIKGITEAQIKDTAMIDLINTVQMHYGKADVAAAAVFSPTANMKKGTITKAGTTSIYKFDNTLMTLKLTGAQLKKYMEWSATYYNTYKSGDITVSFNKDVRNYNYDMFSGVKYKVDISKEAGNRIVNLTKMDGTEIKDTDVLKVAVNNYRANTTLLNEQSGLFKGENVEVVYDSFKELGDDGRIRDLIKKYITDEKKGVITPDVDNNWSIVGASFDANDREAVKFFVQDGKLKLPTSEDGRTPNVKAVTKDDLAKVAKDAAKEINIVTFNDFHGALAAGPKDAGMAKFAGEVNKIKKFYPNTVVVSGGDNFQGSAMSNLKMGEPVNEMMKSLGVIASGVGNHEFDWGTDKIANWAKTGNYKFLAANVYDKKTGKPVEWAEPYTIVEKDGVKIGFVGITTPDTAVQTKAENVKDVEFKEPVATAKEWAKVAREKGANVVIALTHLGSYQDKAGVVTGEATKLCGIEGIDAVISAHSHQEVSGEVNKTPIIQAYCQGRDLGRLTINKDAAGKFKISVKLDKLYTKTNTLTEDKDIKAMYEKYEKDLKPILDEVVGQTTTELSHDKSKAGTSLLGQWTCDVMRREAKTQIGLTNGGGLRVPVAAGDITMGNLYQVMPFDNTLFTMNIKGSDLKRVIENGLGHKDFGWIQVDGIKVYYDIKAEFGKRITDMFLEDGTKIDMDKTYSVVTNDFMATGGDKFDFTGATEMINTQIPIRDALVKELKAVKKISITDKMNLVNGPAPKEEVKPEVKPELKPEVKPSKPVVKPSKSAVKPVAKKYVVVTASKLHVRDNVRGKIIASIPSGSKVEVLAETNGWLKVSVNGKQGYIYKKYTTEMNKAKVAA